MILIWIVKETRVFYFLHVYRSETIVSPSIYVRCCVDQHFDFTFSPEQTYLVQNTHAAQ